MTDSPTMYWSGPKHSQKRSRRRRNEMIEEALPLAERVAARYRQRGVDRDDLLQVARLALVKAADRFDADRGSRFPAFASLTIDGEIKRHFRDQGWSVKPPRSVQEAYLNVRRAQETLCQKLGRQATPDEISEHTDLEPERVQIGLDAQGTYRARALDVPVGDEGSMRSLEPWAYEDGYERVEDGVQLSRLTRVLSHRDMTILRLRFWEGMTQSEIADQVGVSQVQVSRLLRSITETLRQRCKGSPMTTSEPRTNADATRGSTSLAEVLDDFRRDGYDQNFVSREGGVLVCSQCNESFDLNPDDVAEERRVEGVSDPDEMQLAIALRCPICGARGAAVAHFGPMSDEVSDDLVKALSP